MHQNCSLVLSFLSFKVCLDVDAPPITLTRPPPILHIRLVRHDWKRKKKTKVDFTTKKAEKVAGGLVAQPLSPGRVNTAPGRRAADLSGVIFGRAGTSRWAWTVWLKGRRRPSQTAAVDDGSPISAAAGDQLSSQHFLFYFFLFFGQRCPSVWIWISKYFRHRSKEWYGFAPRPHLFFLFFFS